MQGNPLLVSNIQAILPELVDVRDYDRQLYWTARTARQDATDAEVFAYFQDIVPVADIIMPDQRAVVGRGPSIRTVSHIIPKFKRGEQIGEEQLSILDRINAQRATPRENNVFAGYVEKRLRALLFGNRARVEKTIVDMLCDSFTYDRMGVKIAGLTFGMPSDLKYTASPTWVTANAATATPIADIQALLLVASSKYGRTYNRITMSTQAFNYMVGTDEFLNRAKFYTGLGVLGGLTSTTLPRGDMGTMKNLAGAILNMAIELDDRTFTEESAAGAFSQVRYLPANKVILSSTDLDRDPNIWDFAAATIYETERGRVPSLIGNFDGGQSGPVAYATASDPQGNPPGEVLWAVDRGFPRKHNLSANALITAF